MTDTAAPAAQHRWRILGILCLAVVLSFSCWFSANAIAPELKRAWSLSESTAAWLTNGVQIGFVIGALAASLFNLPDLIRMNRLMAGSALLKDEPLVAQILRAVVNAVDVPVTLKIRTGWDKQNRNAVAVARMAEDIGVQALAMHGRTRACLYMGDAEYDTIAAVKQAIRIPLIANGDITTPEKAKYVLDMTGADAVMIGRAAQGRPWIFREIEHYLATGEHLPPPEVAEIRSVMLEHLHDLYAFYGELTGMRVARKHISWYTKGLKDSANFRHGMNQLQTIELQLNAINDFFNQLEQQDSRLQYVSEQAGQGEELPIDNQQARINNEAMAA